LDETFHVQSQLIEACWKCHWKLPALRSQQRGRSLRKDNTKHLIFLLIQGFGEHVIDDYPLVMTNIAIEHGPVEIVDFPINSMVDLSSSLCKRLPEAFDVFLH
jgi:hypothetical protein